MTLFSAIGRVYLLALLLGLAGMLTAPSFAQQAAEIRTGVVKIVITAPAAKIGSGIVVRRDANEAYIVTAAHVVNDAKEFFVQFYSTAGDWKAELKHIEFDNVAKGFALLRVVGNLPAGVKALPLATEVTMVGGEQVRIIGHQASTGDWGVLAGIVSGRKGRDVAIQAPIQEQTSGGPVVLDGRVVGLVQNRDPSGAFGYAVTAQAIREYVEGLQVALDRVSPPQVLPSSPSIEPKPLVAAKPSEPSTPKKFTNSIGMNFVLMPAGSFKMGSGLSPKQVVGQFGGEEKWYEREQPPHDVKISQSFYLQATEVTQGQWKKVMGDNPSGFKQCGDDCPVEQVSWEDAQRFIEKLNQVEKTKAYRLPSEAEWEYACRTGTTTEYSYGDDAGRLGDYAWLSGNSNNKTQRVASKKPNNWGLYDMHGNVREWVEDDWHDSYNRAPTDGRAWVDSPRGSDRVIRDGSWNGDAQDCRSATRADFRPDDRYAYVGFRLSRSVALGP